MIDEKLLENYEDAQMALLMDAYAQAEGEALLAEAEKVEAPFSEDFKAKCMALIDKEFAKRRRKKWVQDAARKAVKAAVIALAVLGFLSVGAMSVQAIRIPVVNFFIQQSEKFSTIFFGEDKPTEETKDATDGTVQEGPLAGLLPDTYKLDSSVELEDGSTFAIYASNQNDNIAFSSKKWDGLCFNIDTEDVEYYEEKTLLNCKAYIIVKEHAQIIWVNENSGMVYEIISGSMDFETLWRLAEQVAAIT